MAIDFNGITLTITLESAITEVDVVNDLYKDWKDWMLSNPINRGFPQALVSDGGAPLTAIINQGSYIFLNNVAGWRIKPPEEDITIFLTGNLAAGDVAVETIVPTDGAFTAAIIGLQPVTQGVVPSMKDNLEFNTFQNTICIDKNNGFAGTGSIGSDRIGTRLAPSNNLDDTKLISAETGITVINLIADYDTTTETTDLSSGFRFTADSPFIKLTVGSSLNIANSTFNNLTIEGDVDGANSMDRCEIGNITNFSGEIFESDLLGDITLIGTGIIHIRNSHSAVAGNGYPKILGVGTVEVIVRDLTGSIGIGGMTGGTHSIGVAGGRIIFEADCTGGSPNIRRSPYEVIDLSGNITWVDQTEGFKTTEIHNMTEHAAFEDGVTVDTGNESGAAIAGTAFPAGTREFPSNNLADALTIANNNAFIKILVRGSLAVTTGNFAAGFVFLGTNPLISDVTISAASDVTDCEFSKLTVNGTLDNNNVLRECRVNNVISFDGFILNSGLNGTVTLGGTTNTILNDCFSAAAGATPPVIDFNGTTSGLVVRGHNGPIKITNKTNALGDVHFNTNTGVLIVDTSCTAGNVSAAGVGKVINETNMQLHTGTIHGALNLLAEMVYGEHLDELWLGLERHVWIDTSAMTQGIGSQASPFNTLASGIDAAEALGITTLRILDDITLDRNLKNFSVIGTGTPTVDTAGFDLKGSEFHRVRMQGTYIDSIIVQESVLLNGFNLNGFFENNALAGDLVCTAGSVVFMKNCASSIAGLGRPTISMNGAGASNLSVRGHDGGLTIKDCNNVADVVTVEIARGSLTFDASCTNGNMVARTSGKFVDLTAGATVTAEVYSSDMWGSMDLDTLPNDKIADMVFKKPTVDFTDSSTIGGFIIKKILTVGKFLGLK